MTNTITSVLDNHLSALYNEETKDLDQLPITPTVKIDFNIPSFFEDHASRYPNLAARTIACLDRNSFLNLASCSVYLRQELKSVYLLSQKLLFSKWNITKLDIAPECLEKEKIKIGRIKNEPYSSVFASIKLEQGLMIRDVISYGSKEEVANLFTLHTGFPFLQENVRQVIPELARRLENRAQALNQLRILSDHAKEAIISRLLDSILYAKWNEVEILARSLPSISLKDAIYVTQNIHRHENLHLVRDFFIELKDIPTGDEEANVYIKKAIDQSVEILNHIKNSNIQEVRNRLHDGHIILNKHLNEFLRYALYSHSDDIITFLLEQPREISNNLRAKIAVEAFALDKLELARLLLQGIDIEEPVRSDVIIMTAIYNMYPTLAHILSDGRGITAETQQIALIHAHGPERSAIRSLLRSIGLSEN
jgi:hypothetical protein